MWIVLVLLIAFYLISQVRGGEAFQNNPDSSHYVDSLGKFKLKYHRYPFDFYSLYGLDDYSPQYQYLWDKNPYQLNKEKEWQETKARRRLGRQYIQMPSYNHVRQLGYTN